MIRNNDNDIITDKIINRWTKVDDWKLIFIFINISFKEVQRFIQRVTRIHNSLNKTNFSIYSSFNNKTVILLCMTIIYSGKVLLMNVILNILMLYTKHIYIND